MDPISLSKSMNLGVYVCACVRACVHVCVCVCVSCGGVNVPMIFCNVFHLLPLWTVSCVLILVCRESQLLNLFLFQMYKVSALGMGMLHEQYTLHCGGACCRQL